MKQTIHTTAFFALLLFIAQPLLGQDYSMGVGLGLGLSSDTYDELKGASGFIDRKLSNDFLLRGSAGHLEGETERDFLSAGDFTLTKLEVSLLKDFGEGRLRPRIGAGVGYYIPETDLAGALDAELSRQGFIAREDLEDSFGFHLLLGGQYRASQNSGFEFMAKYFVAESKVDGDVTDTLLGGTRRFSQDIDLNGFFLTAGYYFKF